MSDSQFYEVEKVVGKRISPTTKKIQYLVKWIGYSDNENTWQPIQNLTNSTNLINEFENSKNKAKRSQKSNISKVEERKSRTEKVQEKNDSLLKEKVSSSSVSLKKKKGKQTGMGNEAVKFEKEIHALPSEIEIVGMGQKGGSIFFKVKGKEDLKWIKKQVLMPKYAVCIVDFYEKNLVFI